MGCAQQHLHETMLLVHCEARQHPHQYSGVMETTCTSKQRKQQNKSVALAESGEGRGAINRNAEQIPKPNTHLCDGLLQLIRGTEGLRRFALS